MKSDCLNWKNELDVMSCSAIAVSAYQAIADAEDDPDEGQG